MSTEKFMSVEESNEQILAAIRAGGPDAAKKVEAIAKEAVKNPHLLDGFKEHWGRMEYHTFRSPEYACKAFNFDGNMPAFSTVHDHAGFWAVYICYRGKMETKFYEEENPGVEPWPGLRELKHLVLNEGDAMILTPEDMHSVFSNTPGTMVLTYYNGDLNASVRRIYDMKNQVYIRDRSQWEARRKAGAYGVAEGGVLRKLDDAETIKEV